MQKDGDIVIAGGAGSDFALVRCDSNGVLDSTFGPSGKVTTSIGDEYVAALSVVVQSDNKIVVSGESNENFALVRYNSNGKLDSTFGSNGKVITDFGGNDRGYTLAIQSDGNIVVAGARFYSPTSSTWDFALARYNGCFNATPEKTPCNSFSEDITEYAEKENLDIYPNPSSGVISIILKNKKVEMKIRIYDVWGSCIINKFYDEGPNMEIDLGSYNSGIYFVEVVPSADDARNDRKTGKVFLYK